MTRHAVLYSAIIASAVSCAGTDLPLGSRAPVAKKDAGPGVSGGHDGTGGAPGVKPMGTGGSPSGAGGSVTTGTPATGGAVQNPPIADAAPPDAPVNEASTGTGNETSTPDAEPPLGPMTDFQIRACRATTDITWDGPFCDGGICPFDPRLLNEVGNDFWLITANPGNEPLGCTYVVYDGSTFASPKLLSTTEWCDKGSKHLVSTTRWENDGNIYALETPPRFVTHVAGVIQSITEVGDGVAACWLEVLDGTFASWISRYDSAGKLLWQTPFQCSAVTTDPAGNLYALGLADAPDGSHVLNEQISKFDSTGHATRVANDPDYMGASLVITTAGDFFTVAMQAYGAWDQALYVRRLGPDGTPKWAWVNAGIGHTALVVDPTLHSYAVWPSGYPGVGLPSRAAVVRFTPDGSPCIFADTHSNADAAIALTPSRLVVLSTGRLGHVDL